MYLYQLIMRYFFLIYIIFWNTIVPCHSYCSESLPEFNKTFQIKISMSQLFKQEIGRKYVDQIWQIFYNSDHKKPHKQWTFLPSLVLREDYKNIDNLLDTFRPLISFKDKMNCELMLTYDTPALRKTGSRNQDLHVYFYFQICI
jgi:hypothetical protein